MIKIYGIKNCDTMKKAFDWLDGKGIGYEFHDYKKSGISDNKLDVWLKSLDIWKLINAKGSTWRLLTDDEKSSIHDIPSAKALMKEKTSVIKRPLVELPNGEYLLGFDDGEWEKKLGK